MKSNSKNLLVSKTEVLFNKKKLQSLLNSSKNSNVVVFSIKNYSSNNDVNVSYQAAPFLLNPTTGKTTPSGGSVVGCAMIRCPYPPGCGPTGTAATGQLVGEFLDLDEKKRK